MSDAALAADLSSPMHPAIASHEHFMYPQERINVLFASDSPFDPEKGPGYIRETIKIIEGLDISDEDRQKIFEGNARRLLKLS